MTFKVGLSGDLLNSKGEPTFGSTPIGLLDAEPRISWEWMKPGLREITPDIAAAPPLALFGSIGWTLRHGVKSLSEVVVAILSYRHSVAYRLPRTGPRDWLLQLSRSWCGVASGDGS